MPNAILNGISIDYTTAGEGPPVLLICGTGQPADPWFAQVADLVAAGHRVITFDNRGCGRSAAPPAPYRVADMAADTAALIEHLGLGSCDIVGYSLGGYIAQHLAATCPALVRRLVLVAGVGAAPAYALARARAAVDLALALDPLPSSFDVADLLLSLHSMRQLQNDDDAVKVTSSLIEAGGPWTNPGRLGQYQADLDWLQDGSHLDRLSHITSPCLAMAFEDDCWFPPRVVREAAQRMAGCQYVELTGLGHGAPLLAPREVNPSSPSSSPDPVEVSRCARALTSRRCDAWPARPSLAVDIGRILAHGSPPAPR
jgi:pimeloyl-ACP methyl ester carboxylesterase